MTVPVLALLTIACLPVAAEAAPPATAEQCADETVRWGGDITIGGSAAASYDTGIEVPASNGATLTVVGVSADGLAASGAAHVLPVHVGGMRATAGAAISGGRVTVSTTSVEPLRVAGVTVVVRRCAIVASAPAAPVDVSSDRLLPETGANEWRQTMIGAAVLALGVALVSFGRRSPTAGGREPGSPRVGPRPARG